LKEKLLEFRSEGVIHKKFKATSVGYDWNTFPMKLYQIGKRLFWDPAKIDFSKDKEDWKKLSKDEKNYLLNIVSLFMAGEEAVAVDITPLISTMINEGRVEDVIYLEQFAFEEAKHAEAFRRFCDSLEINDDLTIFTTEYNPWYQKIFYEELPSVMWKLRVDPSPENLAVAVTTYNLYVEGVAAESGYKTFKHIFNSLNIMPGLSKTVNLIATDESRHIAYGTYLITRLIVENGESIYRKAIEQFNKLVGIVQSLTRPLAKLPFGLTPDFTIENRKQLVNARLTVIERALKMTPEQVKSFSPKDLGVIEEIKLDK